MSSMTSPRHSVFITPLPPEQRFDVGSVFSAHELPRRVLSIFWRDCCQPAAFSRAPAPVIELSGDFALAENRRPLRAWWLMDDGIIPEAEGPHSDRLRPFFGGVGRTGQLWPRYEFRVVAHPFEVEMSFHRDPLVGQGTRTRLALQPDGRIRVLAQEPWWGG